MKSAFYGWIEASLRYTGRFGPREKTTYQDIFQVSAPTVSRHQEFVANAMEEASETALFHRALNGHVKGGKLLLLADAKLPSQSVFARVPTLESWLEDTFGGLYFHNECVFRDQADAEIVRLLIRSLVDNKVLRIQYHSKTGIISRTISPHIIVKVAGRLHLRAFDHYRNGYRDYVLSRISQIQTMEDSSSSFIGREHDHEWNSYVTVEVREKTIFNKNETQAIRMDFGLEENGMRPMRVREPLAPYLVDIEDDNFKSPVNIVLKSRP